MVTPSSPTYILHNVGTGSAHRKDFRALAGRTTVPYLVDPNTDTAMFESGEIVAYLRRTYGA